MERPTVTVENCQHEIVDRLDECLELLARFPEVRIPPGLWDSLSLYVEKPLDGEHPIIPGAMIEFDAQGKRKIVLIEPDSLFDQLMPISTRVMEDLNGVLLLELNEDGTSGTSMWCSRLIDMADEAIYDDWRADYSARRYLIFKDTVSRTLTVLPDRRTFSVPVRYLQPFAAPVSKTETTVSLIEILQISKAEVTREEMERAASALGLSGVDYECMGPAIAKKMLVQLIKRIK